jgi:protein-L-isoaspartate(D-aspartate) O-methyltransferase
MSFPSDHELARLREKMVREQLAARGITTPWVLEAMSRVERHRFVPPFHVKNAYADHPVPIGTEQTLSQPYIVALMSNALGLEGGERVLEVGTGSGYQTAILAERCREVFTVEVVQELSARAERVLGELGYENIRFRVGDGRLGWPSEAPFDGILVTAAPRELPEALRSQLGAGGRLVIPLGPSAYQELECHERDQRAPGGFRVTKLGAVRFVPLI